MSNELQPPIRRTCRYVLVTVATAISGYRVKAIERKIERAERVENQVGVELTYPWIAWIGWV